MRRLFCLMIAVTAGSMVVGCGGSDTESPTGGTPQAKTPPSTSTDSTVDDQPITQPSTEQNVTVLEAYRDIASFSYKDKLGHQWLSQWIISADGLGYWSRYCSIDKAGPDWANCTSFGHGFEIAELGLPTFGAVSGMSSYVYNDASDGVHTQWVAQTFYSERGDERVGRICPIEDSRPYWQGCSAWEKLAVQSTSFQISMASSFRDEEMITYKNDLGEDVFAHTLLSVDGSLTWSRSCVSEGGMPWVSVKQCEFGSDVPVGDYAIKPGVIGGSAAYTYEDVSGNLVYAETVIAVDGVSAQRRECPMTGKGPDWQGCGAFTTVRLDNLLEYQGPL